MVTLSIILIILLLFIAGILFIPMRLVINTNKKEYFLSLPGYFRADLIFAGSLVPRLKFRVFFFTFKIEPGNHKKKAIDEKPINKTKKQAIKNPFRLMKKIMRNINIKKLHADIDTGDFPLNAQLIPVTQTINGKNINVNINFENRNNLEFKAVTRIFNILWVSIKHILFNK